MKSKRFIKISAAEVESIIKDLSLIVVSADHMGSTYYNKPRKLAAETEKFVESVNLFKMLSHIRGKLSVAYNSQSNEKDILKFEEEAEKLPYWRQNKSRNKRASGK